MEGGVIKGQHHPRFGRTCERSVSSCSQRLKIIQAESYTNVGTRLFNCPLKEIRELTRISMENFARKLDKFLEISQMSLQYHMAHLHKQWYQI